MDLQLHSGLLGRFSRGLEHNQCSISWAWAQDGAVWGGRHHSSQGFNAQISPCQPQGRQGMTPEVWPVQGFTHEFLLGGWIVSFKQALHTGCFFRTKLDFQTGTANALAFQSHGISRHNHNTDPQDTEKCEDKTSSKFPEINLVPRTQDTVVEICKETEHLFRNPMFMKDKGIHN